MRNVIFSMALMFGLNAAYADDSNAESPTDEQPVSIMPINNGSDEDNRDYNKDAQRVVLGGN